MPVINIDIIDNELKESVSANYTDSELEVLDEFHEIMHEVRASPYMQAGLPMVKTCNITLAPLLDGSGYVAVGPAGTSVTSTIPYNALHLKAFLTDARLLLLENDPPTFKNVAKLIGREFNSSTIAKKLLKYAHRLYREGPLDNREEIIIGGHNMMSDRTFKAWINGQTWHRDREHKLTLKQIYGLLGKQNAEVFFVSILTGKILACEKLDIVVKALLEQK